MKVINWENWVKCIIYNELPEGTSVAEAIAIEEALYDVVRKMNERG